MDAHRTARLLWAAPEATSDGFPRGEYRVETETRVTGVAARVEGARVDGDPFAACFLRWDAPGMGPACARELTRLSPGLFLVLEGPEHRLPDPDDLGPWARPDRCLLLPSPPPAVTRRSLAEHLCARWRKEEGERRRLRLLESEARHDRATSQGHQRRMQVLYGLVEQLHRADGLDEALGVALGDLSRFLGARSGSVLLLDSPDHFQVVEAVGPHSARIRGLEVPVIESRVARYALEEREPILVEDIQEGGRFAEGEDEIRFRPRSILSVPLLAGDEPLGVLNFGGDAERVSFSEHDRRMLVTLGRQVAVAVEKARLVEGLRRTVSESIRALAGAIEAKDPYTRGHSDRVTHYSRLIARTIGLSASEVDVIVRAAVLHDVGKIGVPRDVLNKPGKLDDDEYRLIQRHPVMGAEIVSEIKAMEETLDTIRLHHERIDGRGYPDGVKGEAIPVGARILAVADTFDAMTSDRPYRAGLPPRVAFEEIERCSGTQFDPEIARAFLDGAPRWPDLLPDTDEVVAETG